MFTKSNGSRVTIALLSLGLLAASSEFAAAGWAKSHPGRAEVNARLTVQNWRINQAEKHGKMTAAQAHTLRTDDRFIRKEERFEASQHGGHITRSEWKSLNQQENGVSKHIP